MFDADQLESTAAPPESSDAAGQAASPAQAATEENAPKLCPWLASLVTPPPSCVAEHLPNGGLLMSAIMETFDVENPAHIAAAIAPLNDLPWEEPPAPERRQPAYGKTAPSLAPELKRSDAAARAQ